MSTMMRHYAGISTDELSQTSRFVYASLFCQEDRDSQRIMVSTWLCYEDTMNQQYKSQFMYRICNESSRTDRRLYKGKNIVIWNNTSLMVGRLSRYATVSLIIQYRNVKQFYESKLTCLFMKM